MSAWTGESAPFEAFLQKSIGKDPITVSPLAGDASNRRYYRVISGSLSWVLMQWDPFVDDENYPFLSVQRHFLSNDIHVPEIIAKSPAEGLVLLEDLGDLTLERKFWEAQNPNHVIPFYEKSLDEISKIHFQATAQKSNCTAFRVAFDTEKLLWEMNYGRTHLLEKFCKIQFTPAESKKLDDLFKHICERLDKEPKVICHRDYHSRNLMIKLDKVRVIDFQDARMGPIQYDLVSLFKDSYVTIQDSMAETLLQYYLKKREDFGIPKIDRDQFNEIYELQSIQRCFKACGSFSSFYNTRADTRYLKYIQNTLQRVKTSISQFKPYHPFAEILDSHGVFDREYSQT